MVPEALAVFSFQGSDPRTSKKIAFSRGRSQDGIGSNWLKASVDKLFRISENLF
jgi:hypothetical protein